jgi:hypothetical protein
MMVLQATWDEIGKEFTDDEKAALSQAVLRRVTCPPGIVIDKQALAGELAYKLATFVLDAPRKRALVTRKESVT